MSSVTPQATILAQGVRIAGDMHLDHDAHFAGHILGNLHVAGHLTLADTAYIDGDITADRVTLAGHVTGKVTATQLATLRPGARVQGPLTAAAFIADPGAIYTGQLQLGPVDSQTQPRATDEHTPTDAAAALLADAIAASPSHGDPHAALMPRRRRAVPTF